MLVVVAIRRQAHLPAHRLLAPRQVPPPKADHLPVRRRTCIRRREAGGGKTDYDKITVVERAPTTEEVREAGKAIGSSILDKHSDSDISNITSQKDAISLPNDTIYTTAPSNKPLTVHEIEHQSQYQNGDKKDVFERLVGEALAGTSGKSDPYNTPGTLEYEAQQVQKAAVVLQKSRSITW